MSIFNINNPLFAAYLQRNPNSFLSKTAGSLIRRDNSGSTSELNGSNNAGGVMPPSTTPSIGANGFTPGPYARGVPSVGGNEFNPGPYARGMSPFGGPTNTTMPQYPSTGSNNDMVGGSPVSFAEGGMMTDQGTAIRPNQGMMPPSAGTGRTLPSARFKVEAQMPQGANAMPPSGQPLGAAAPAPMDSAQIEQEAQRFVQQHPQEVQKIQEVIALAMQTGELTPEELNTAVQLAKTALARPESYPQIRAFAVQNGLATEQDIPQQMDQGLLYALIVAGKAMQSGAPTNNQGNAMQGQGPSPTQHSVVPEYREGGMTGDKPHIAKLHAREYVIPEDTLIYHGKKHFDKLVEQARTPPNAGTN